MSYEVWLKAKDPLLNAVEYLDQKYSVCNWTGIYILRDQMLELGPYIGAHTDHVRIPVGRGVCGRAVKENRDLNIPDVTKEDNYLACSLETKSELVCLIKNSMGQILGQIDIDSRTPSAFTAEIEAEVRKVATFLGDKCEDFF